MRQSPLSLFLSRWIKPLSEQPSLRLSLRRFLPSPRNEHEERVNEKRGMDQTVEPSEGGKPLQGSQVTVSWCHRTKRRRRDTPKNTEGDVPGKGNGQRFYYHKKSRDESQKRKNNL